MQLTEEQQKELQKKLKNMSPEQLQELQKQNCIFCKIIKGEIPARIVFEDDLTIAVLDINPAAKGHILILPKEHYAILPQVNDKQLGHLFIVAKKLSQALLKSLKADGTTLFIANGQIAGQRAQHVILHLIPRKDNDHLINSDEKPLPKELLSKVKEVIQPKLNEQLGIKSAAIKSPKEAEFQPVKKAKKSIKKSSAEIHIPKKKEEADLDDISSLFK